LINKTGHTAASFITVYKSSSVVYSYWYKKDTINVTQI